jgi:hypothetical protein
MLAELATTLVLATAGAGDDYPGCHSRACVRRVQARGHGNTVRRWKRTARPYAAWLRSTRACESGSAGGYTLSTTGNGFWFAYQHTASSWYAAGGRRRNGRPAGVRSLQPTPAEQDFRAVVTLRQQGRGAWPVCG